MKTGFGTVLFGLSMVGWLVGISGSCRGAEKPILELLTPRVGQYGRVEFRIKPGKSYEAPFDPREVAVDLEVSRPDGKRLTVPAFYMQAYEYRRVKRGRHEEDWIYPRGVPVWKARFSPRLSGRYACTVTVSDRLGSARSDQVTFDVHATVGPGFIHVSKDSSRYLEFGDGSPYFPIGQNLAFIGCSQYVDLKKADNIFEEMGRRGANFARIWTGCKDWAIGIEARKSAWGRSWAWDTPFAALPGEEDSDHKCVKLTGDQGTSIACRPSHRVALKPNTRYLMSYSVMCRKGAGIQVEVSGQRFTPSVKARDQGSWKDVEISFATESEEYWLGSPRFILSQPGTVFLKDFSLKEEGGDAELLWEADPNRPVMGKYNQVDCFMVDRVVRAAERNDIRLQLCLATRDLYMSMLEDEDSEEYGRAIRYAKNLMRYVVARWGYSTAVASWEYFNEMNPGLPTGRFYWEVGRYVSRIDPYDHPRTTSTWAACPRDWRHRELDTAQEHFYLRPDKDGAYRDEVQAILEEADGFMRQVPNDRPPILGECGLATENWGLSELMSQDRNLVHFHNILWASAMSGLSGTGMFWWWEQLDQQNAYRHYRPLAEFMKDVPFIEKNLAPAELSVPDTVHAVGLRGADYACLWVVNRSATWWVSVAQNKTPQELQKVEITVKGLPSGTYRVDWWDTREGTRIGRERAESSNDALGLTLPRFNRDIACKIYRP